MFAELFGPPPDQLCRAASGGGEIRPLELVAREADLPRLVRAVPVRIGAALDPEGEDVIGLADGVGAVIREAPLGHALVLLRAALQTVVRRELVARITHELEREVAVA